MTRDELVEVARKLEADGTVSELDALLNMLVHALRNGNIGDLLYHTTPRLTAEQAVDEALRRQRVWNETHS